MARYNPFINREDEQKQQNEIEEIAAKFDAYFPGFFEKIFIISETIKFEEDIMDFNPKHLLGVSYHLLFDVLRDYYLDAYEKLTIREIYIIYKLFNCFNQASFTCDEFTGTENEFRFINYCDKLIAEKHLNSLLELISMPDFDISLIGDILHSDSISTDQTNDYSNIHAQFVSRYFLEYPIEHFRGSIEGIELYGYDYFRSKLDNPSKISLEEENLMGYTFDDDWFLFWWTYHTLRYQFNNECLSFDGYNKIVSTEEKKYLSQKCSDRIFSLMQNSNSEPEPGCILVESDDFVDILDPDTYYESCYVILNSLYFLKSSERLLDLVAYAFLLIHSIISNSSSSNLVLYFSLKDLPYNIKDVFINRTKWGLDSILNKIHTQVSSFFNEIQEMNSEYNLQFHYSPVISEKYTELRWFSKGHDILSSVDKEIDNWFLKNNLKPVDNQEFSEYLMLLDVSKNASKCIRSKDKEKLHDCKIRVLKTIELADLYKKLETLSNILKILDILQEGLAFLNIKLERDFKLLCTKISQVLTSSIDEALYYKDYSDQYRDLYNVKYKNSREDNFLKDFELEKHKKREEIYQSIISRLDEFADHSSNIQSLIDMKTIWIKELQSTCSDPEIVIKIDSLINRMGFHLEKKVSETNGFYDVFHKIEKTFANSQSKILTAIKKYGLNIEDIDKKFKDMMKTLATGEFLYQKYITDASDDLEGFDYSCIALQYYTALESLLNIVFYLPYKTITLEPLGQGLKRLDGYLGKAAFDKLKNRSKLIDSVLKESLELGTISYLYIDMFDSKGQINATHIHLSEYLAKLGLNDESQRTVAIIADNVYNNIRTLRNNVAHASVPVSSNQVSQAKESVFDGWFMNRICAKRIADSCKNLIPQILTLFD